MPSHAKPFTAPGADAITNWSAAELDGPFAMRALAPAASTSPGPADEVAFINGIDANGRIDDTSFWGFNKKTAFKWGDPKAGTAGGTITYEFDPKSHFTATEQATWQKAMAMWSAIANVHFKEVSGNADALLTRGSDGGAHTSTPTSDGHGATLGQPTGQGVVSIDTSVQGFDLSGSFSRSGGYGLSTVIHELGHLLGLGHGGYYNGTVDPSTQQFSAFDDRDYSIMSYIWWGDGNRKFDNQTVDNTYWGTDKSGDPISAPYTPMALDDVAIQELYGASHEQTFAGGQTFGFHSNIKGVLHDWFDFTVDRQPVVTLFDEGKDNTLDLSGYSAMYQYGDLHPGAFSSACGGANNICIDVRTQIDHLVMGSGNDYLIANDFGDRLEGGAGTDLLATGAGSDTLTGGAGDDQFYFYEDTKSTSGGKDVITDFTEGQDLISIAIPGVTSVNDLGAKSDGHGGTLVTWKGEVLDVEHDTHLSYSDFYFDSNSLTPLEMWRDGLHGLPAHATSAIAIHAMAEHIVHGALA